MTSQQPRQPLPQQAHQRNYTSPPSTMYGPNGLVPPAKTANAFTAWTIASAMICVLGFVGSIAAITNANYTDDLAFGIAFAVFAAAGFIGMILSRIGAAITRSGARR